MEILSAAEPHLAAMCELVNREIEGGVAHFGLEPVGVEAMRAELAVADARHPWLVAIDPGGRILGFARASPWKSRGAYAWTVEIGVYVAPDAQGRGIGRALYERLFAALAAGGARTVLAGITLPNPASVRLHEAFGMRHVGTLPRVGWKRGAWHDVGYWARHLGEGAPPAC